MRRTLVSLIVDAVFIRQPRVWPSVAHTNKVSGRRFSVITTLSHVAWNSVAQVAS